MNRTNERIAIHEAGHFVHAIRIGIKPSVITIVPDQEMGSNGACGIPDYNSTHDQVMGLLSGYAAVAADGRHNPEDGTSDDFEDAADLLNRHGLGSLDEWKEKALQEMRRPENLKAVRQIAAELTERWIMEGKHAVLLVKVADGETTIEEHEAYLRSNPPFEIHPEFREEIRVLMEERAKSQD